MRQGVWLLLPTKFPLSGHCDHWAGPPIWCKKKDLSALSHFTLLSPGSPDQMLSPYNQDDPGSGFTNVTMAGMKQEDSGTYQGEAKDSNGATIPYRKNPPAGLPR